MKNQKKIKEALKTIKRELSNALYYASQIEPMPKDKKSAQSRTAVQMSIKRIEDIIKTDLSELEKEIEGRDVEAREELFRDRLATINSPSQTMKKTAEMLLESSKQPNLLMKKAMQEQIRKASIQNAKEVTGN
jgi:hypothetical protein